MHSGLSNSLSVEKIQAPFLEGTAQTDERGTDERPHGQMSQS